LKIGVEGEKSGVVEQSVLFLLALTRFNAAWMSLKLLSLMADDDESFGTKFRDGDDDVLASFVDEPGMSTTINLNSILNNFRHLPFGLGITKWLFGSEAPAESDAVILQKFN
jgi:hypothetical protein